jgi:hypothetical protein
MIYIYIGYLYSTPWVWNNYSIPDRAPSTGHPPAHPTTPGRFHHFFCRRPTLSSPPVLFLSPCLSCAAHSSSAMAVRPPPPVPGDHEPRSPMILRRTHAPTAPSVTATPSSRPSLCPLLGSGDGRVVPLLLAMSRPSSSLPPAAPSVAVAPILTVTIVPSSPLHGSGDGCADPHHRPPPPPARVFGMLIPVAPGFLHLLLRYQQLSSSSPSSSD